MKVLYILGTKKEPLALAFDKHEVGGRDTACVAKIICLLKLHNLIKEWE